MDVYILLNGKWWFQKVLIPIKMVVNHYRWNKWCKIETISILFFFLFHWLRKGKKQKFLLKEFYCLLFCNTVAEWEYSSPLDWELTKFCMIESISSPVIRFNFEQLKGVVTSPHNIWESMDICINNWSLHFEIDSNNIMIGQWPLQIISVPSLWHQKGYSFRCSTNHHCC